MPCPFFEPRAVTHDSTRRFGFGRLPLIEEFNGVCHRLGGVPVTDPDVLRKACNMGLGDAGCTHRYAGGNLDGAGSVLRFTVASRKTEALEVTVVEESGYAPLRWQNYTFSAISETLSPSLEEPCQRAQLLAFCRSYLRKFPSQS